MGGCRNKKWYLSHMRRNMDSHHTKKAVKCLMTKSHKSPLFLKPKLTLKNRDCLVVCRIFMKAHTVEIKWSTQNFNCKLQNPESIYKTTQVSRTLIKVFLFWFWPKKLRYSAFMKVLVVNAYIKRQMKSQEAALKYYKWSTKRNERVATYYSG